MDVDSDVIIANGQEESKGLQWVIRAWLHAMPEDDAMEIMAHVRFLTPLKGSALARCEEMETIYKDGEFNPSVKNIIIEETKQILGF